MVNKWWWRRRERAADCARPRRSSRLLARTPRGLGLEPLPEVPNQSPGLGVWGVLFSSRCRTVGVPSPDGGLLRSVVLSSEKGLQESFPGERSRAVVREGVMEEAPYEQTF